MDANLKLKLKQSKVIRVAAFPVVNAIRGFRFLTYCGSEDAKRIRAYKNTHVGERCFIIGNGPSLSAEDLEQLKGEYCFAANKIYKIFDQTDWRPDYYLCVDSFMLKDIRSELETMKLPNIFVHLEGKKLQLKNAFTDIIYINNYYPYLVNRYKRVKGIRVSRDVSHHFTAGETVTFNSIQLALYMGFSEIYLLGVDHNYSRKVYANGEMTYDPKIQDYFGNMKSEDYSIQNIDTSTAAYQAAKAYCSRKKVTIKNLTRGGQLEVFPRAPFDEIIHNHV